MKYNKLYVASEIACVASTAALTLVDPRTLNEKTRKQYQVANAAVAGLLSFTEPTTPTSPSFIKRLGINAVTMAGSYWLASGILDRADTAVHEFLARRGVQHPRRAMALTAAGSTLGSLVLNRITAKIEENAQQYTEAEDQEITLDPVNGHVQAIVNQLLAEDRPGAEALRTQLETAQQLNLGAEDVASEAYFVVEDSAPRTVPREQQWPVSARFTRGDYSFVLTLQITDGQLAALNVGLGDDLDGAEEADLDKASQQLTTWPVPDELEISVES